MGVEQIKARLRRVSQRFPEQVEAALYKESQIELTEVKRRTPVDLGTLRASEFVEGPSRQGTRIYTKIVAGGASAPYAIYVHEDLEAFHKVGQAKFVESVILESRPFMGARIARRLSLAKLITEG